METENAEKINTKEKKNREKELKKEQKRKEKAKRSFERWFVFLRFIVKIIKLFLPYEKHYAADDYGNGPYVMLCNHYRLWDVIYPCTAIPGKTVHYMAKNELWNNAFLRWFCKKCQCIPVSRDGTGTDVKAVMSAIKYLKNGESIAIFPEGTRNKEDADMLPFKGGFAAIAIKTKTPVLPIVQIRKAKFFKKSHILYGKPVIFEEYYGKKLTEENLAECEKRLRDIMLEMRADFIKGEKERHKS